MSFSFAVPATPSADFVDAAAKAKAAYETAMEGNDYMLTQLASGLADAAVKAGESLVEAVQPGTVTASLSGHYADDGKSASTVSVSISVVPVPAAPSA